MADPARGARALTYDPGADAARRYPDWVIRHRQLPNGIPEVLCRRSKVILLDHRQTWPEKRCSLAHAVAHLDLEHHHTHAGFFANRMEDEANHMAARRLITRDDLERVLSWTRYRTEIAAELVVDLATLDVRHRHMHVSEKKYLRNHVRWLEETA